MNECPPEDPEETKEGKEGKAIPGIQDLLGINNDMEQVNIFRETFSLS